MISQALFSGIYIAKVKESINRKNREQDVDDTSLVL